MFTQYMLKAIELISVQTTYVLFVQLAALPVSSTAATLPVSFKPRPAMLPMIAVTILMKPTCCVSTTGDTTLKEAWETSLKA